MKARFWTEVHDGAKLFYLSGLEKSGRCSHLAFRLAEMCHVRIRFPGASSSHPQSSHRQLTARTLGRYPKTEVHNLARFISVAKFRPLIWRNTHPYVLADRFEEVTDPEVCVCVCVCVCVFLCVALAATIRVEAALVVVVVIEDVV